MSAESPPSYVAAAASVSSSSPQQQRIRNLMQPPPKSLTLTAALQLLQQPPPPFQVYLMDIDYLQNWLIWALHQTVPKEEATRVREAIRLAALQLGLVPPTENMEYDEPGPIDSTSLSVEGHALLLNPLVEVMRPHQQQPQPHTPEMPKRRQSIRTVSEPQVRPERALSLSNINDHEPVSETKDKSKVQCLAVNESFYETLRAVHGVLCDDGFTISFQPHESERLLLHHQPFRSSSSSSSEQHRVPRPIEFRRKTILVPIQTTLKEPHTLMDKLLWEQQQPMLVPTTEVHPVKLLYSFVNETVPTPAKGQHDGFVLVSRQTAAIDALAALLRVAEPHKANQSLRLWGKHVYQYDKVLQEATQTGDMFELVDTIALNERREDDSRTSVEEWVSQHGASDKELEVLVESRKTVNSPWPREFKELENRFQVGDTVDAQDVAGQWFEAVVREVEEETVKVHYVGWSSRWDAKLKRRPNAEGVEGVNAKLKAPMPLWSKTQRWREHIRVGQTVEVRDTSSIVSRPKWYKGVVKKAGKPFDTPRKLEGGADLELYDLHNDPSKQEFLLVLGRTQQILVEVKQERVCRAGGETTSPGEGDLAAGGLTPQPPHLRWVNLYGEEICKLGTHLKDEETRGPATLKYVWDSSRKPVEVMKAHPSLGSGFMRESLRGNPPAPGCCGLHNLGNSCFLSSILQCTNHIEPLTQYFLTDKYSKDLNRKNPLGSGGNVAVAYASLLKKTWGGEYSTLAPRLLKQTVANFAPQFDNCYQHDSQEFCQFLMDGLHEDLNRVQVKPYVEELEGFGMEDEKAAIESWRKHLLRHDSIIVDHCQGMHRSHLTCPRCGRESIKFDVFSSISLPIATDKYQSTITLEDCLEKFMEGEQLDERNAWYCPSCRQHVCALKMIALWSVPDTLILHLKRFTFDTCMTSGGMLRSKVDAVVEFPIERLDLTKHILGPIDEDAPPIYTLFGVSEHSGPTANSGHYTATVRNSIDNQWYKFNDSHVGLTSGEASMTGGAYLLFYQRKKGLTRWAGMEKVMKARSIDPYGGLEKDQDGFMKVKAKKKKKSKTR